MSYPIYVIATISERQPARAWGWYPTHMEAREALLELGDNIWESGTYTHGLIEEVFPGFMAGTGERKVWWYKSEQHADESYTVISSETPSWAEILANFTMG